MTYLHTNPPMTLRQVDARARWLLPAVALTFVGLALAVVLDRVPWDDAIHEWVIDHRSPWRDTLARRVSWFGSTYVVLSVSAIAAAAGVAPVSATGCGHRDPGPGAAAVGVRAEGARQPAATGR